MATTDSSSPVPIFSIASAAWFADRKRYIKPNTADSYGMHLDRGGAPKGSKGLISILQDQIRKAGHAIGGWGTSRPEDVKKLTGLKFQGFQFEAKCMPKPQRSLIGHPGATFFRAGLTTRL